MDQTLLQFLVCTWQLLFQQKWPFKFKIILIISQLTVVLSCFVSIYAPINFQRIVDNLIRVLEDRSQEFDWSLLAIFTIVSILEGIGALSLITCLQQMLWLPVEQHIRRIIQIKFMEHLHTMSFNWMIETKISDIMAALERGTDSIVSTIDHILYCVIPTIVNIILAMGFLFMKFGWLYALIVGFQILLYSSFTLYVIEKRSFYQRTANAAEDILRNRAMESVQNLETVRGFGNELFEKERYSSSLRRFQNQQFHIDLLTNTSKAIQYALVCMSMLICSYLIVSSIASGDSHFTPGDYALLTAYLARLNGPLNYLAGYYRELRVNIVNAGSMMKYFDEKPEIISSPFAQDLCVNHGVIEFRDVSLTTDSKKVLLKDISFTVAPNTTVALVGTTGSGKTSIARLLLRIVDASRGQILIDGVDVKDVCLQSLRRSVGIIPQDITLFNDTIRNNIRYGKPNASDHEVRLAASLAEIHEKISSFPFGYSTVVGERGACLSGGERQRIAISRAILKNPKILILDEATSALDTKTEKRIQETLKHLFRNRTCLMITHNLRSTVNADMIFVLNNGRIVEKGSHSTLIKLNGQFAKMWKYQTTSTKSVA